MLICSKCKHVLGRRDRYCRICGTKRSPVEYSPEDNVLACVYGPPYSVKCKCLLCGHKYVDKSLGEPHKRYFCPRCGGPCSVGGTAPSSEEILNDTPEGEALKKILERLKEDRNSAEEQKPAKPKDDK